MSFQKVNWMTSTSTTTFESTERIEYDSSTVSATLNSDRNDRCKFLSATVTVVLVLPLDQNIGLLEATE